MLETGNSNSTYRRRRSHMFFGTQCSIYTTWMSLFILYFCRWHESVRCMAIGDDTGL